MELPLSVTAADARREGNHAAAGGQHLQDGRDDVLLRSRQGGRAGQESTNSEMIYSKFHSNTTERQEMA